MMNTRDTYFDALKGLLIILVVVGHFGGDYTVHSNFLWMIKFFIYIFHMPTFVFISGYFSNNLQKNAYRASKHLLMFVVCQLMWILFSSLFLNQYYVFVNWLIPGESLWYIIALAVWRASLNTALKIRFVFIISTVVAILSMFTGTLVPILAISRIIGFFPFFLLGVYSHEWDIVSRIKKIPLALAITVILMLVILSYFTVSHFGPNAIHFLRHNYAYYEISLEHGNNVIKIALNILSYILALIGGCSVMRIVLCIKNDKILTFLGRRTLPIYILHNYIRNIILKIQCSYNLFFESEYINYAISLFFVAATILVLSSNFVNNLFNVVFGKINKFFIRDNVNEHLIDE